MERDITKVSISEKLVSVQYCTLQMGGTKYNGLLRTGI